MLTLIVLAVIIAVAAGLGVNWERQRARPWVLGSCVLIAILWFGISPAFGQVPAGNRGVVLRFGGVTGDTLGEGLYFLTPFINSVELMSTQTHAMTAKTVEAASHDLQTVHTDVVVNYHLDPLKVAQIYQQLRQDYEGRVLAPAVQEVVKANTAQYEAERLITQRAAVKESIDTALITRFAQYGFIVDTVSITNFDFSKDFEASIEQKVIAEQLALKAKNDLERIKIEADQVQAKANGEAQAISIRGQALKENPGLVQLEAVQKWDGKLPVTMAGDTIPFLTIK